MTRPLRDVDSVRHVEQLRIVEWSLVGLPMGGALAVLLFDTSVLIGTLTVGPIVSLCIWVILRSIVTASGVAAAQLFTPSGRSTPFGGALSREETLIVRGRLEEAIEALIARAMEDPRDPRPRVRLAELYRDELRDLEESAVWYRRAAAVPGLSPDSARQVLRELLELCRDRLGRPEMALPALRRAADLHAGSRLGVWAGQEIRAIRAPLYGFGSSSAASAARYSPSVASSSSPRTGNAGSSAAS